ncbi:Propanediol utilization protein PduX [Neorhizobium galegae bv. officinalis]|uniref:Propanediol utilization protein PduX n=1 Tax=Neorhizobium galegae bv. officinalis TaxID=323656 RepID=A0A0T7H1K1_NEOGA|nr:hypothetical protein [Neorhizobium galegae]CDZ41413.1 Propanediol utilization protein PduX [Neorhizobium galegae bv. officinalis]CDZ53410.1 Propanediol utilization protein PduX [Neorhizobium galegae bv. officinalis]
MKRGSTCDPIRREADIFSRTGHGRAIGHHGELIQGVFEDCEGRLQRGLISLPCRDYKSRATLTLEHERSLSVTPVDREKAKRAAKFVLDRFGPARAGGQLSISSNIPIGRGMGSSTADVLASIIAAFDSLDCQPSAQMVMEIAVAAEGACDSTLYSQLAVLFAQREGAIIESFKNSLPLLDVISVDTTPDRIVDTLKFPPAEYVPSEIELFRVLRGMVREALGTVNIELLGKAATASAEINERFLPKPGLHEIKRIGDLHGAAGVQVAHSGTVVGLMFDPKQPSRAERLEFAARQLGSLGFEPTIIGTTSELWKA